MASMTFGQKIFQPKPPIEGSFPLDHEGECKKEMLEYLICMSKANNQNTKCREQAKEYLNCRMNKNLMEKRDLKVFGYNKPTETDSTPDEIKK
jgi:cytochrome c oxidase assembly protein subunit 19